MPNHCQNNLTVSGDKQSLDRFWDTIHQEDGTPSLSSLYPMPSLLESTTMPTSDSPEPHPKWAELLAKGEITQEWHDKLCADRRSAYEAGIRAKAETGYTDWYNWALDNWGTKWGDYDHFVAIQGNGYIELGYMTAWGPFADKFWHHVSQQFPTLDFVVSYDESGMAFCGASSYRNGETLAERYVDDYTQLIGVPDWDDTDKVEDWNYQLCDLRDRLTEQVSSGL